ncbi:hypothetical protein F5Y16DRAFT_400393 [Xylariaceae sp. FL0255]|nr:hypothetical protein F5Y16DRAFT_400393 [Xylariaceae sp. FL0255]
MPGPGFDLSCDESQPDYDLVPLANPDLSYGFSNITTGKPITVFEINFQFATTKLVPELDTVNFTAIYKENPACTGSLVAKTCVMRLATVKYPVTLADGFCTLQKWTPSSNETLVYYDYEGEIVLDLNGDLAMGPAGASGWQTLVGGLGFAVQNRYESSVIMNYQDGTLSVVLPATSTQIITAYHTRYEFLVIVVAIALFELGIIMFLLYGWWELGRDVSLDTFEISKALGARTLDSVGSNIEDHSRDGAEFEPSKSSMPLLVGEHRPDGALGGIPREDAVSPIENSSDESDVEDRAEKKTTLVPLLRLGNAEEVQKRAACSGILLRQWMIWRIPTVHPVYVTPSFSSQEVNLAEQRSRVEAPP